MKRTLALILLFAIGSLVYSQGSIVTVTPYLSTKAIASCVCTLGSTSISATAKPFGSVTVGMPVYGPGVPENTTVASLPDPALDSVIVLSNAITSGGTKTLEFGYYVHTTYASGDWLGLPFQIYDTGEGGTTFLISASISDNSDLLAAVDLQLFTTYSDTLGLDSVAVNVPSSESAKFIGAPISFSTITDHGGVRITGETAINQAVPRNKLWGRLIARATVGPFLVVQPFTLKLGFAQ